MGFLEYEKKKHTKRGAKGPVVWYGSLPGGCANHDIYAEFVPSPSCPHVNFFFGFSLYIYGISRGIDAID